MDRAELAARFDEPLPEHGVALETILGELERRSAGGLAGGTGGRYFGYVTGGSLPAAAIVEAWTAAVDQNPGMWPLGPAAVELEQVTIGWLAELLGFPAASGYFGSGATMANTVALAVARHSFGRKHGVDVTEQGVRALPELAVYGSEELHLSDHKALRTLGLGSGCVRKIPIDERYAMRVDLLAEAIERDRAARRRAGDRDRAGRFGQHRRVRPDRRDRRRVRERTASGSTSTARSARSSACGHPRRRSSQASSAPTRWRSMATSG